MSNQPCIPEPSLASVKNGCRVSNQNKSCLLTPECRQLQQGEAGSGQDLQLGGSPPWVGSGTLRGATREGECGQSSKSRCTPGGAGFPGGPYLPLRPSEVATLVVWTEQRAGGKTHDTECTRPDRKEVKPGDRGTGARGEPQSNGSLSTGPPPREAAQRSEAPSPGP